MLDSSLATDSEAEDPAKLDSDPWHSDRKKYVSLSRFVWGVIHCAAIDNYYLCRNI